MSYTTNVGNAKGANMTPTAADTDVCMAGYNDAVTYKRRCMVGRSPGDRESYRAGHRAGIAWLRANMLRKDRKALKRRREHAAQLENIAKSLALLAN